MISGEIDLLKASHKIGMIEGELVYLMKLVSGIL